MMALLDGYDCVLFDLDGVLFRGDHAIRGAPEAVARVRAAHAAVAFVTNNSARTPQEVWEKLTALGIGADPGEVVTSALATADLLSASGGGTAFVIGERGIVEALTDAGIGVLEGDPDAADHVVVGWDRRVDYAKLRTAAVLVQRGARLVATNADPSYPAPDGLVWPGAGAILAAVEATTGAVAEVVGKPYPPLFRAALARSGGHRPLVVGDRLDTDIAGAAALGWDSLLVLTGVATRVDLADASSAPTYVGRDVGALFEDVPRENSTRGEDRR